MVSWLCILIQVITQFRHSESTFSKDNLLTTTIKPSVTIFNILQHKEIECRSYFGKYSECVVGGPIKFIYFRKQLTSNECRVNQTYGTIPDFGVLWVNKDCSGLFDIYYEIKEKFPESTSSSEWNENRGVSTAYTPTLIANGTIIPNEYKTFSNEYKSVVCESRGPRSECELFRNISSLRLLRQLSYTECSRKRDTYGHYGNRIWVDRGCRAKFEVRFKLDEDYYYSLISDRRARPDQRVLDDFLFCASPSEVKAPSGNSYRECPLRAPAYEKEYGDSQEGKAQGKMINNFKKEEQKAAWKAQKQPYDKSVVIEKFKLLKSLEAGRPCIFNVTYGINVRSMDPEDDLIYRRYRNMIKDRQSGRKRGGIYPYGWLISSPLPKMALPPRRTASFVWVDRGCAAIFQLRIKVKSPLGYLVSLPSEYRNHNEDGAVKEYDRSYAPDTINIASTNTQRPETDNCPTPVTCPVISKGVSTSPNVESATFTSIGGVYGRWKYKITQNITNPSKNQVQDISNNTNYKKRNESFQPTTKPYFPNHLFNAKSYTKQYTPKETTTWYVDKSWDGASGSDKTDSHSMVIREYITFCGSGLAEYRECAVGKIIAGIKIYRQIPYNFQTHPPAQYPGVAYGSDGSSPSPKCIYQKTFGYRDQNIWVANGCQAIFTVYLPDEDSNSTISKPSNNRENAEIICQSLKGRNQCPTPGNVVSIALVEEYSIQLCNFGETFGHHYNFIWVDDGCQGKFRVAFINPNEQESSHDATLSLDNPGMSVTQPSVYDKGQIIPFICNMELAVGNCSQNITRYFYEGDSGTCLGFSYSGCGGNENNFLYLSHCQRTCQSNDFFPCLQPPKIGNCSQYETKFFYSPYTSRCETFTYSGCQGNYNKFSTLEECAATCDLLESICALQPEPGNGSSIQIRYFYNPELRRCQQFVYTGTDGNSNRFKTEVACMKRCAGDIAQHGEITLTCASYDFSHKECDLGIPVVDLLIERRLSVFPCEPDVTYGMIGSKVWVFQGCSARFKVRTLGIVPLYIPAFTPKQDTDTPDNGQDENGWNHGYGYNGFDIEPIPNEHEMVACSSENENQLQICPLKGSVIKISLFSEISNDVCVEGKTYGRQTDNLWVFNGCQAQFLIWKQ